MAPRSGRIARARLVSPPQLNLLQTAAAQVRSAMRPGFREERYGRLWRIGQVTENDGHLHGHLGFEKETGADLWDDDRQDFTPTAVQHGLAAPFLIRLHDFAIVFQPRQDIRIPSFTGALRSMLSAATTDTWTVRPLTGETDFDKWRASVDRVVRIRFRQEKCAQTPQAAQGLVQQAREAGSDLLTVDLRARAGIDSGSPLVRELLGYARDGMGDLIAYGSRDNEVEAETAWNSTLGGESILTSVPVDPVTGEADLDTLRGQLARIDCLAPE
ncbi:hypothetical protein ACIBCR_22925 [Micromonospora echinospora]|uniref:hypothetical protein n=1 Tax=Micromonospora echinospora TaxID=1877 RepID=UPI0037A0B94E